MTTIHSKDYFLPISYKLKFSVEDGILDITNNIRFITGSCLEVKKTGTVKFSKEAMFYSSFTDKATQYPYPSGKKAASLLLYGKALMNSSLGGIVTACDESAQIITSSSFNSSASNKEMNGDDNLDHSETAKFTLIDSKVYDEDSETSMHYCYDRSSKGFDLDTIEKNKTYDSFSIYGLNRYGFYNDGNISFIRYGIRFVLNDEGASNPNVITSFDTNKGNVVLQNLINSKSNLIFNGFYYSSELDVPSLLETDSSGNYVFNPSEAVKYLNGKNYVTIYAKWIDQASFVTVKFRKYSSDSLIDTSSYSASIGDTINLESYSNFSDTNRDPTVVERKYKIEYTFSNWSVKDSSGNNIPLTNNTFVPSKAGETYYVEPNYTNENYLALIVKNKKHSFWYAISKLTINTDSVSVTDEDEHVFYVNKGNSIFIQVEGGISVSYSVLVKIANNTITIGNNKNLTISFKDYETVFDQLNGPITVTGQVS